MAEDAIPSPLVPPPPAAPRPRRAWDGRWQRWLLGVIASLILIVVGALVWLDTTPGHRFLASRIATIKPVSGLRIRVDRIDGSIYRKLVLHNLALSDPKGVFLDAPRVELDWWPFAWMSNRLDIDRLVIPRATLRKLPKLNPTQRQGPILPGFDIRLMQFSVGRLDVAPAIAGRAQVATMAGDADVRGGRAIIDLTARTLDGGDALTIALDSRPDKDRFSLDVTVNAPKGGVLAAMAGLKQAANLRIGGKGSWSRWDGRLSATLDAVPAADFTLAARSGAYSARGSIEGAAISGNGLLRRMADPRLMVRANGTMVDRVIDGHVMLQSTAFDLGADGAIDLRNNALDNMLLTLKLARPQALLKTMRGSDINAKVRLDGPFAALGYEYLLTAKQIAFDKTVIHDVRAEGKGRAGTGPALIPVKLRARRLDGQGDLIEGIVRNFQIDGVLQLKGQQIVSNPMPFRSDKLRGKLVATADLKTGRYDIGLDGQLTNLFIRGLGIVDLTSRLHAAPRADGAFGLTGTALARVRRLDNEFLRSLGGGLPTVRGGLDLLKGGELALTNLTLESPLLTLTGRGLRHPDQTLHLEASGRHQRYGPLQLTLDGMIEHPTIDLLLQRPMDALGLRDVKAHLIPDANGYSYVANGGSTLGPFAGRGVILLPPGGQAVVRVANLAVSGVTASGDIRPINGGLDGQLAVNGPVTGYIGFKPINDVQQVQLQLNANDASFEGPTVIAVRRGTLNGTILLDPDGTTVTAMAQARGLRVGGVLLGRFAANAELVDGKGKIRGSLAGQRGRIFDLQGEAQVEPDRIRLSAGGTIDKRAIRLDRAALLTRTEDGWHLSPATISYAGGSLQLAGELGATSTHVEARMQKLPLSLLDIAYDNLGLGGMATGSLSYAQPRGGGLPTGKAELRIRGLSRSGLSLSSRPVDVGVNAILSQDRLATRMVFVSDGKTIGQAQALLNPLGSEGNLVDRLNHAPFFAQLRYNGTADTLWRLVGVEIVDIGGPVAVSADMRGTLGEPAITGTFTTDNATINSPVTGMRLNGVKARGRFSGAQLVISSFAANAQNGGTVNGTGRFTFNGIAGVGMDLALQADNAALLERDDIAATVTGPITIRSDGVGGTIGGDLTLNKSRFTMGRAAAVAEIPELRVIEVNRAGDEIERARAVTPWTLAIKARARNRLAVTGLGIESEWRANLDIGGSVTNPTLAGTADLLKGTYDFAGRRFDLREGKIQFDGRAPVNPTLDIDAEADVSDLSATIHVGGTGLKPDITFSSTPALPQDELLSRILFGTSITSLSAPEALQLASAVGSLQGNGGLDPINAVRKAAGLDRLRIIAADPTQGQGTSIAAGKYLTRKTYVELITDGQGYSATRMEYQVTRWLSLLGAISTLGRQSANVRVSKDY